MFERFFIYFYIFIYLIFFLNRLFLNTKALNIYIFFFYLIKFIYLFI